VDNFKTMLFEQREMDQEGLYVDQVWPSSPDNNPKSISLAPVAIPGISGAMALEIDLMAHETTKPQPLGHCSVSQVKIVDMFEDSLRKNPIDRLCQQHTVLLPWADEVYRSLWEVAPLSVGEPQQDVAWSIVRETD
jgi:hypothetical protein